ncbi:DUF421 domain-containing protein [Mobilitalea sibirica]|uniref:DUF421 domain-containing protein n=1 Tax=Mobilitalea sibirica TaxID=1462919 RepID=A0A8J7HCX4_9FIRM|nr:DUF421 domain-containing protein [Mobilitalea sibirica]MBH1941392.1 DUF421 domain-containing protein [Mobilitalea sibirica]
MGITKIVVSTLVSLTALFTVTKLMGNREMSQLSMFDYVSSVAIGSIAGEMAILSTDSIIEPLVSMLIYTFFAIFVSYMTCKSIYLRRFFEGQAILLYQNGQIFEKNLLKAKLDIDELLSVCRISGYYNLEEVHTIYLETNGNISVLPMTKNQPVTPKDLNIDVIQSVPLSNIIIDGKVMKDNLKSTGKNIMWLEEQLKQYHVDNIKEVILATYDESKDKVNIYFKNHKKMLRDIFE